MNSFNKFLIILGSVFFTLSATAGLVVKDYNGVSGGITFDSDTNIEWLDLSFTESMSVTEYQDFLNTNGEGWQFATKTLVGDLFSKFGATSANNTNWGNGADYGMFHVYAPASSEFMRVTDSLSILGEVMSASTAFSGVRGFAGDILAASMNQFAMYYNRFAGVASMGDFIEFADGRDSTAFFTYRSVPNVQPIMMNPKSPLAVPEPATWSMFLLVAFSFLMIRKKRS